MESGTGKVEAGSVNTRISGPAAIVVLAGLLAALAVAILGQTGATGAQKPADVEKALIEHRAGERAPLSGASSAADVDKALIEHRAGERAALSGASSAADVEKALIEHRAGER